MVLGLAGCSDSNHRQVPPARAQCSGESSFVSADPSMFNTFSPSASDDVLGAAGEPTQPQIFYNTPGRVWSVAIDGGRYRVIDDIWHGLKFVDLTEPSTPKLAATLPLSLPSYSEIVGMHVRDDRLYVVIEKWATYADTDDGDWLPGKRKTGMILTIDVSEPAAPQVTGRTTVDGELRDSVLADTEGPARLVVVGDIDETTFVASYRVSEAGAMSRSDRVLLAGMAQDVELTPRRAVLGEYRELEEADYDTLGTEEVRLIDITRPDGQLDVGNAVQLSSVVAAGGYRGAVEAMALVGDVLRVAYRVPSGADFSNRRAQLETLDASDIHHLSGVDHTVLDLRDVHESAIKAPNSHLLLFDIYMNRYQPVGIDPDGHIHKRPIYETSHGLARSVPFDDAARYVGLSEDGRKLHVGLYDAQQLGLGEGAAVQRSFELDRMWEAYEWKPKLYTILEDSTQMRAASGEREDNLLLVQMHQLDEDDDAVRSAVQIFSFSATTITRRGVMEVRSGIQESFSVGEGLVANVSDQEVSVFDITDPDKPAERGRDLIASDWGVGRGAYFHEGPRQRNPIAFGEFAVWRRHATDGTDNALRPREEREDTLVVVPRTADPDAARPRARMSIEEQSLLYAVGDALVSISRPFEGIPKCGADRERLEAHIKVWDMSNPASPRLASDFVTDRLDRRHMQQDGDGEVCASGASPAWVVGDSLVFRTKHAHSEPLGTETGRSLEGVSPACASEDVPGEGCVEYVGHVECKQNQPPDGDVEPELCAGAIWRCPAGYQALSQCETVQASAVPTRTFNTYTCPHQLEWKSYSFQAIDLRDPDLPKVSQRLAMPDSEQDVSIVAHGESLFVTHRERAEVEGDARPYLRYFFRELDFSNPARPRIGRSVNIPGELIDVDGDRLVTRDTEWGDFLVASSFHTLERGDGRACLRGSQSYPDQSIKRVGFGGDGRMAVTHEVDDRISSIDPSVGHHQGRAVSVLDLEARGLPELADYDLHDFGAYWANIHDGRLLVDDDCTVVVNIEDPDSPFTEACIARSDLPMRLRLDGQLADGEDPPPFLQANWLHLVE